MRNLIIFVSALLISVGTGRANKYKRVMKIPNKVFDGSSELFCTAQPIEANQYFVEFKMVVDQPSAIHHISIVMCDKPYSTDHIWDCTQKRFCKPGTAHRLGVFTWGREANGWKLPEDTGIAVGNTSKYMLLQVHTANKFDAHDTNESGIEMIFSNVRRKYEAGLAILGNTGKIPPKVKDYPTDSACEWRFNETARVVSYSMHTHAFGRAVSAYIIRNGEWIEIGRGDPSYPEVNMDIRFKRLEIRPGDIVVSRCTYDNTEDRFVNFGHAARDEMCNFHIHYSYPFGSGDFLKHVECSADAETFHWNDNFKNIPANNGDPTTNTDQAYYIRTQHWTKKEYRAM